MKRRGSGVSYLSQDERVLVDAAWRVISEMRMEHREPSRLWVSGDWPHAVSIWGVPTVVSQSLAPKTVVAEPICVPTGHEVAETPYLIGKEGRIVNDGRCLWCGFRQPDLTKAT